MLSVKTRLTINNIVLFRKVLHPCLVTASICSQRRFKVFVYVKSVGGFGSLWIVFPEVHRSQDYIVDIDHSVSTEVCFWIPSGMPLMGSEGLCDNDQVVDVNQLVAVYVAHQFHH
jgi:hypothetical protein